MTFAVGKIIQPLDKTNVHNTTTVTDNSSDHTMSILGSLFCLLHCCMLSVSAPPSQLCTLGIPLTAAGPENVKTVAACQGCESSPGVGRIVITQCCRGQSHKLQSQPVSLLFSWSTFRACLCVGGIWWCSNLHIANTHTRCVDNQIHVNLLLLSINISNWLRINITVKWVVMCLRIESHAFIVPCSLAVGYGGISSELRLLLLGLFCGASPGPYCPNARLGLLNATIPQCILLYLK